MSMMSAYYLLTTTIVTLIQCLSASTVIINICVFLLVLIFLCLHFFLPAVILLVDKCSRSNNGSWHCTNYMCILANQSK